MPILPEAASDSVGYRSVAVKGRGSGGNPDNRYAAWQRRAEEDLPPPAAVPTEVVVERTRSALSRNDSPDVPFEQSLNPYRGCEHGCPYCYARPSHAWWGYSPGLDFETRIVARENIAECLAKELAAPGYRCVPLALGANTDAWQPVERQLGITRRVLEICAERRQPVLAITKSALIERDIDLLANLAQDGCISVAISITSLEAETARALEPRAASPGRRLEAVAALAEAGVPVGVMVAPVVPALTDHETEAILAAAAQAGAGWANYVLLRLPGEVAELFSDWLQSRFPGRAAHVLSLLRQYREGVLNDPRFKSRMTGSGTLAAMANHRFHLACRRLGLATAGPELSCAAFFKPGQLSLFD